MDEELRALEPLEKDSGGWCPFCFERWFIRLSKRGGNAYDKMMPQSKNGVMVSIYESS